MNFNKDHFLFVEKYRPQTVAECILPAKVKTPLMDFLANKDIPNLILESAQPGSGKTTCAKAIVRELGADSLIINCASENGIDVIRGKITQFASTVSFEKSLKIIILEEYGGNVSYQNSEALKATMEEFSKNTRFIITTNNIHKIIQPIQSRCTTLTYHFEASEKQKAAVAMLKRVENILELEKIEFDKKAVAALVAKYFPDFRKTLNEIQRYSANGKIDGGILVEKGTTFDDLVESLKAKKFGEVRKWVARNADTDCQVVFRYFFDKAVDLFQGQSIPEVILLTAQYQFQSAQVIDKDINTTAFLIEVMSGANWK